jgi:hypothetical protein
MADGKPAFKVTMTAKGVVQNPDGTTKEIILTAERPITDDEVDENGNYIGNSSCERGTLGGV